MSDNHRQSAANARINGRCRVTGRSGAWQVGPVDAFPSPTARPHLPCRAPPLMLSHKQHTEPANEMQRQGHASSMAVLTGEQKLL